MQFYVMLRTKKREVVLYHALDEKGGAVLHRAEDEGWMQFYVMLRTKVGCSFTSCPGRKKGVKFYVVLRTKVGCSFTSCPLRRSEAVLCHAQDENKFKTPSISCHEPGVLWFYLGTLHLVWLCGNYTKKTLEKST